MRPQRHPHARRGVTLLETMVVMSMIALVSSILVVKYGQAIGIAKMTKAKQELQTIASEISSYLGSYGALPSELDNIGFGGRLDPWGNPYMYLNFEGASGNALDFVLGNGLIDPSAVGNGGGGGGQSGQSGQSGGGPLPPAIPATVENVKRKDKFLFPLNTDYDLFSLGPNGKAWSSIAMDFSLDDVIRANDGAYFGVASAY